ncbi:MAG: adenylosuccinate lyase [Actinobacteria bacterium]|nr:adenylosuccinate lyase [Cyanobacteriota bacterium]MCL5771572.1 adenylosuccinate lyase [Actinomycetota bacterium]
MIPRYTLKEMGKIWEDNNKYSKWLQIEKAVALSQAELGIIPQKAADDINSKANFDISEILKIEEKTNHDVIAFLTNAGSYIGESSKYLHYGLTSSDIGDTALSLQIVDAINIIEDKIKKLIEILKNQAIKYKYTIMVGRTHGIHAEPVTFGLKFAVWAFEMNRNLIRILNARENIRYGKISGAVGTYANTSPELEKLVCEKLGLKNSPASTQILQRDRHAEVISALAICGGTLEKIALEVRNLQRTDVKEVEEPFTEGQKGSSAMPHKKNPIICERICGMARILRGNAVIAFEDMALWHERDISHSSAERVIFPDSFIILDYLLEKTMFVIGNIKVISKNMERNLMKYGGIIFSQRVLLELVSKGLSREEAYSIVQGAALKAWEEEGSFKENLLKNETIMKLITESELDKLFDVNYHLKYVDTIINRLQEI